MIDFTRATRGARGFSLVELLIAIFILGVGIISIAALFPAGIKQQQRSVDDVIGPIVANNAMAIIRSKVRPEDFGRFEDFSDALSPGQFVRAERFTVDGDWSWIRPSHVIEPDLSNIPASVADRLQPGDVDIFSGFRTDFGGSGYSLEYPDAYVDTEYSGSAARPEVYGIPWSRDRHGNEPPQIVISQVERYFPMQSIEVESGPPRRVLEPPKFVWDCMFRRFQGRIYVGIFVYRVTGDGGDRPAYSVVPHNGEEPPVPLRHSMLSEGGGGYNRAWDAYGEDGRAGTWDDAIVRDGSDDRCDEYEPFSNWQAPDERTKSWQHAGQWLIDQNNGVHEVIAAYCAEGDDSPWGQEGRVVELKRPVPTVPLFFPTAPPNPGPYWLPHLEFGPPGPLTLENASWRDVVDEIWYVPLIDGAGRKLTPVYVTVREL